MLLFHDLLLIELNIDFCDPQEHLQYIPQDHLQYTREVVLDVVGFFLSLWELQRRSLILRIEVSV